MELTKKAKYLILFIIIIIFIREIYLSYKWNAIGKEGILTKGRLYKKNNGSQHSRISYMFEYKVDGIFYTNTTLYAYYKYDELKIGDSIWIVYNKNDYEDSYDYTFLYEGDYSINKIQREREMTEYEKIIEK